MSSAIDSNVALGRQDLMDHFDHLAQRLSSCVHGIVNAGLAIGVGSTAKVLQANTVTYSSKGVNKSATTAEVAFTAVTMNIPANAASVQEACYYVGLDGSGALSLIMGTISSGAGTALLPGVSLIPDGVAVIGYVRIAVAAGSTSFVAGTTALSNGALTVTYINFLGVGDTLPQFGQAI